MNKQEWININKNTVKLFEEKCKKIDILKSQLSTINDQIDQIERMKDKLDKTRELFEDYHLIWCGAAKCSECLIDDCALKELGMLLYGYESQPASVDITGSNPLRYFLIIGSYIKYPMGCCTSETIEDVHEEEPDARFYEIPKEEFNVFEESNYNKNINWYYIAKTYEELNARWIPGRKTNE